MALQCTELDHFIALQYRNRKTVVLYEGLFLLVRAGCQRDLQHILQCKQKLIHTALGVIKLADSLDQCVRSTAAGRCDTRYALTSKENA